MAISSLLPLGVICVGHRSVWRLLTCFYAPASHLRCLLPQEEVAEKTRQLKALFQRYEARKAEGSDLQQQFQVEREDLLADYRALTQQIKLKNLVIACFIPPEYQELIMQHCTWREYDEQWVIDYVEHAGRYFCVRNGA